MSEIVLISKAELNDIIATQLNKVLAHHAPAPADRVDIEGAVAYLNDIGCPISKHTLYGLVAKEEVPFGKFGRRLVFSRKELAGWAERRTEAHPINGRRERQRRVVSEALKSKGL